MLSAGYSSQMSHTMTSSLIIWIGRIDFHMVIKLEFPDGIRETLSETLVSDVTVNFVSSRTAVRFMKGFFLHVCNRVNIIFLWRIDYRHLWIHTHR